MKLEGLSVNNKKESIEATKELVKKITDFYEDFYKEDIEDEFIDKSVIEKRINGEISFYTRVLNSLKKSQLENPENKVIALFDIDETLVSAIGSNDGYNHIIRPSAVDLLKKIKEFGIENGVLTTRSLEVFKQQLDNELKDLNSLVNSDYIFSSRGVDVPMIEEEKIKKDNELFANGDIEKIFYLNNLIKDKGKNINFVPIDDLQYPSIYPNGVALEKEEKFFL